MSTVKTDSVIGSFLPIPVIEHATDSEVYTATAGQTVFTTTKFDRSNAIRAIAKSSGGAFSEVTASWTGVNTVTISGTILGAGQIFYIFKVGTHASKIRVQDNAGTWVDLSAYSSTLAQKGANSDITQLTGLTTALSIAQGGTGATTADAARAALGVTGRNRIINGDCRIAQRGSISVTAGAGGLFGGPDRFKCINGAAGQFTQISSSIVDPSGLVTRPAVRQTVDTAAGALTTTNYWNGIMQFIEGFNVCDLPGQLVNVSFLFNTNVGGTYSVALRDGSAAYSYVTSFVAVANTPLKVSFSTTIPTSASIPATNSIGLQVVVGALNAGTYQTPTPNTWVSGNYFTAAGAVNWGATAGNYISLTDLQLEVGAAATPFERRSYGHELLLCQRYYYSTAVNWVCYQNAGNGYGTMLQHSVPMRASPSVTASGVSTINTTNGAVSASAINYWHSGSATASGVVQYSANITFNAEL